jgi:flagellar hook protein FlgE
MSFYTSLTGLKGAQTQMSVISNNIANVSSNGFKKSRVEFGDIMTTGKTVAPSQLVGSGTVVKNIQQQFGQGSITQTSSALDLAISGEGFFAVRPGLTSSAVNFTRNGAFTVDADRYVVDSNGANLLVYPVDGSGSVVASGIASARNLQLPLTSGDPKPTGAVTQSLNLPGSATVIPDQDIYTADDPYEFDRFNSATYNNTSNTTIYDSLGNPLTATTYYVRTSAADAGQPTSTWVAHTFVGDQELMPEGSNSALTLTFDNKGKLVTPAGPTTYAAFDSGAGGMQTMSIDYTGSTQQSGAFTVASASQDGYPVGQLDNVTVGNDGVVTASFSNGNTEALGKIVMATFSNPNGLKQNGLQTWSASGDSGSPDFGMAGAQGIGGIQSGALEQANVDLTEELVDLIAAQRFFQANSKAIEASNNISETIMNIRV